MQSFLKTDKGFKTSISLITSYTRIFLKQTICFLSLYLLEVVLISWKEESWVPGFKKKSYASCCVYFCYRTKLVNPGQKINNRGWNACLLLPSVGKCLLLLDIFVTFSVLFKVWHLESDDSAHNRQCHPGLLPLKKSMKLVYLKVLQSFLSLSVLLNGENISKEMCIAFCLRIKVHVLTERFQRMPYDFVMSITLYLK